MHEIITWETIKEKYSQEYRSLLMYIRLMDDYPQNSILSRLNNLSLAERIETFEVCSDLSKAEMFTGFFSTLDKKAQDAWLNFGYKSFLEIPEFIQKWIRYFENDQYERLY